MGWVARPPHNPNPQMSGKDNGENRFVRKGKFKKASNMNYGLMISNKIEEKLLKVGCHHSWTPVEEQEAYDVSLAEVLAEEEGRAWAEGNIRVGDYILLIDSDTRVPQDCLLDAATEMEQSPEVGILQYSSGVMQVTDSFFENGYVQQPLFSAIFFSLIFLCYLITDTTVSVSRSSRILSTPQSASPLPTATWHLSLAIMQFSVGPHYSKSCTRMKTATRNSGPSLTFQRTLTCPSACKSRATSSV